MQINYGIWHYNSNANMRKSLDHRRKAFDVSDFRNHKTHACAHILANARHSLREYPIVEA